MSQRNPGPFLEYFYIPEKRIKRVAEERLTSLALIDLTGSGGSREILRRRWGFAEDYVELPKGILGKAEFRKVA